MIEKHVTWGDFESLTDNIVKDIMGRKELFKGQVSNKFNWVISINRGGLVPGIMLANKLGSKHAVVSVSSPKERNSKERGVIKTDLYLSQTELIMGWQNILIVDNISRTGESLKSALRSSKRCDPDIKNVAFATLHCSKSSPFKPEYFGELIGEDVWINYPWEQNSPKLVVLKSELQEQITAVG